MARSFIAPAVTVDDTRFTAVDHRGHLSRHEIVYHAPPTEGYDGFPVGNGSYGGMYWSLADGMVFQANHTDTLEHPDPTGGDEGWAILRSCGRLMVRHPFAVHDWLNVDRYEAKLSLHRAEVETRCEGAFGSFSSRFLVHADRPVAMLTYRAAYRGPLEQAGAPVSVQLERWGSRVLKGWYSSIQSGASMALGEATFALDKGDLCLHFRFRGGSAALRLRVLGASAEARLVHARMGELTIPAAPVQEFTVLLSCVAGSEDPDPPAAAKAALDSAAAQLPEALRETHRHRWDAYWRRSFLTVSDDYVENLYHLHLYLMGSSSRGHHPPYFNGGLWIWNRDVRNWVNPHHWNQQQSFWCLPAANRSDYLMPYLETYTELMPEAMRVTRECGYEGLRWSEQHDYAGRHIGLQSESFRMNHTPAAQISLFYWWHYRFTGDVGYLRDHGYPFLRSVGDFFLAFIAWNEARGEYEIPLASTYEDERPLRFTNTITTLSMARRILSILDSAEAVLGDQIPVDEDKRAARRHMLRHLPDYQINERDAVRGPTLASGFVNGTELPERETHNHGPLFCPVFPADDVGLADRGTRLFEVACNTLATYPASVTAITPTVIIAARLGMAEHARRRLHTMIENLQHFPNGLFFNIDHWYTLSRRINVDLGERGSSEYWAARGYGSDGVEQYQRDYLEDRWCRFRRVRVLPNDSEAIPEHRADIPAAPFSQMGMESLGSFAAGLQEMLLQSYENAIRVFPAVPDDWSGAFALMAEGGFLVSSRKDPYLEPEYVEIRSTRGGPCVVVVPWSGAAVVTVADDDRPVPCERRNVGLNDAVGFETEAGLTYLVRPDGADIPPARTYTGVPNQSPKRFRVAMIGRPSDW